MKKLILTIIIFLGLSFISIAQYTSGGRQPVALYNIGLNTSLGGYVFQLSADKKHGLVVETKDQGGDLFWSWDAAKEIMRLACIHTPDAVKFKNWRLPTKDELNLMYNQRNAIGGFSSSPVYWSSTPGPPDKVWYQSFSDGHQDTSWKWQQKRVRAVRSF